MRFTEILNRLTGLSTPVFGVSWKPVESETDAARRIISYLEDRRVLYVPSEMELPSHCVYSVLEIRSRLTDELGRLPPKSRLSESLRAMRAACRKFLADVEEGDDIVHFGADRGHWASWRFNGAVGELRGVFGVHLAQIAASFGLDIEHDLASILPGEDEEI